MDELPTAFGKYFLAEKIATGGMAEIFLAKLIGPGGFEKTLIIKQIHPELSGTRQFVDLFVAEAKTLVSLSHGNVVPVYELGVVDDVYFIAMEYIDGPTLRVLVDALGRREARMTPASAAYVTAEILKGLEYAHRKGVIHRDLSPRNVMLSRDGEVKLVDFGIALREGDAPSGTTLAGSYPYMSPEQVRGEELTPQSDLFSAGVLFWEMLTGQELFARASAEDTLRAVTDADVAPPSALAPGVPAVLDALCMRALRRDRAARFPDASAFLVELNRCLYALAEPVTSATLAELVARTCPPEVRGRVSRDDEPEGEGGTRPLPGRVPAEERTRPLPGRTAAPRGKRRAPTVRSFATHVGFREVLARATPLLPIPAITDDQVPATPARPEARAPGHPVPAPPARSEAPATPGHRSSAVSASAAPRSRHLARLSVVAALLAATAVIAALALRDPGARAPAELAHDAALMAVMPARDAAPSPPEHAARAASLVDAAPVDAASRPSGARPSRSRPEHVDAAAPRPRTGVLKVGANPWGEVYLDGQKLGRAPNAWTVAAGPHAVDVVFPVAGREQRRSFQITVLADQPTALGIIDFTTGP